MHEVLSACSNHSPACSVGPRDAACLRPFGRPCPTGVETVLGRRGVTAGVAAEPCREPHAALHIPPCTSPLDHRRSHSTPSLRSPSPLPPSGPCEPVFAGTSGGGDLSTHLCRGRHDGKKQEADQQRRHGLGRRVQEGSLDGRGRRRPASGRLRAPHPHPLICTSACRPALLQACKPAACGTRLSSCSADRNCVLTPSFGDPNRQLPRPQHLPRHDAGAALRTVRPMKIVVCSPTLT